MKKEFLLSVISLFFLNVLAQSRHQDVQKELKLEEKINKWNIINGHAILDNKVCFEGEYSLQMFPSDSIFPISQVFYPVDISLIDVDSISFSGKFKYKKANNIENSEIIFGIQKIDSDQKTIDEIAKFSTTHDGNWNSFNVKASVGNDIQSLLFVALSRGDVTLWIDDVNIEFDNKSLQRKGVFKADQTEGFTLPNILINEITKTTIENIEAIAQVWGFVKYYHPSLTTGQVDCDVELFKILQPIINSSDLETRNEILHSWIEELGEIDEYADYTISDSLKYSKLINLDWINETKWGSDLRQYLNRIKNAKRSNKFNYYIAPYMNGSFSYNKEKPYFEVESNSLGGRLLTLFRFWNTIEYCYPYKDLIDIDWKITLNKYIPMFIKVKNIQEYEFVLASLVAELNDSHGQILTKENHQLNLFKKINKYPATLRNIDGQLVVESVSYNCELKQGDVILNVEFKEVKDIFIEMQNVFSASNIPHLWHQVSNVILDTNNDSLHIVIQRGNDKKELVLRNFNDSFFSAECNFYLKKAQDYDLHQKNIAYFDLASIRPENASTLMHKNMHKKGIIFDLRSYPEFSIYQLAPLLMDSTRSFAWFASNQNSFPGCFKLSSTASIGGLNEKHFKGKVVILVDEKTMSRGEFTAMGLRTSPNSTIIGSTTAGADGNIASLPLPGGMSVIFTGLGAFYPNWEICQRKGIKIDIPIHATIQSIEERRDIWIERAIEHILD